MKDREGEVEEKEKEGRIEKKGTIINERERHKKNIEETNRRNRGQTKLRQ